MFKQAKKWLSGPADKWTYIVGAIAFVVVNTSVQALAFWLAVR